MSQFTTTEYNCINSLNTCISTFYKIKYDIFNSKYTDEENLILNNIIQIPSYIDTIQYANFIDNVNKRIDDEYQILYDNTSIKLWNLFQYLFDNMELLSIWEYQNEFIIVYNNHLDDNQTYSIDDGYSWGDSFIEEFIYNIY
jgi:hypothetical protein